MLVTEISCWNNWLCSRCWRPRLSTVLDTNWNLQQGENRTPSSLLLSVHGHNAPSSLKDRLNLLSQFYLRRRFSLDAAPRLLVITTFVKIYSTVNLLLHPRLYFDWLVEEFITNWASATSCSGRDAVKKSDSSWWGTAQPVLFDSQYVAKLKLGWKVQKQKQTAQTVLVLIAFFHWFCFSKCNFRTCREMDCILSLRRDSKNNDFSSFVFCRSVVWTIIGAKLRCDKLKRSKKKKLGDL